MESARELIVRSRRQVLKEGMEPRGKLKTVDPRFKQQDSVLVFSKQYQSVILCADQRSLPVCEFQP